MHEYEPGQKPKKMKKVKRFVKRWRRVSEQDLHHRDFENGTGNYPDQRDQYGEPQGDPRYFASPHDQLQYGLQSPTQDGGYNFEHDGRHLPRDEYQPATQLHQLPTQLPDTWHPSATGVQPQSHGMYDTAQHPSSDIADITEQFNARIERKRRKEISRFEDSKSNLLNELRDVQHANAALQDRLDRVEQEKTGLGTELQAEKTKVRSFKLKAAKFRTFVDGLGNDIESLRREANSHRLQGEEIAEDVSKWQETQATLLKQKADGAERSSQLTSEALRACQAVKAELATAKTRLTHLQQDVSDKAKLLAEEKDIRTQRQSQAQDALNSYDAQLRDLKANTEAILENQHDIQATAEDEDVDNRSVPDMLEKLMAAIQNLNSTQSSTVEDVLSVKGQIETLSEEQVSYVVMASIESS